MKKELSPTAIVVILAVVAIIGIVAGILYFKPAFGPGPVVEAPPFRPPASWNASTPAEPGAAATGTPVGAPASPDAAKSSK